MENKSNKQIICKNCGKLFSPGKNKAGQKVQTCAKCLINLAEKNIHEEIKQAELKHETQSKSEKKKTFNKKIILSCSVILLISSIAFNINRIIKMNKPVYLAEIDQIEDITINFYNMCLKIEQYKKVMGQYPQSLDKEIDNKNYEYTLNIDGSFTITYKTNDNILIYNSFKDYSKVLEMNSSISIPEGGENEK
jgi:hypothetical protein